MALRLLRRDPSLSPLFVAVGLGVVGALGFGVHYLRNSPDVVVRRSGDKEPWNRVEQGKNTKLFSPNKEWWNSRAEMPHPRAMFMSSDSPSLSDQAAIAKAKAIRAAKEKAGELKEDAEIGKNVMIDSIEGRGGKYGAGKESTVEH
ncbi:NDUFA4 family protein [Sporobolomyces koalae]|uniref:NDUFA4 family protein n=1 Tax=Sporobolomyces koalae TaxID=500713 RepID=UPI00316FFA37